MFVCETCGSREYHIDAGFFYCKNCQTQSQHYYEQKSGIIEDGEQVPISRKKKKESVEILTAADRWTSWEAFNHILYGMTQELKSLDFVPEIIENIVLQLWACQLHRSQVGFLSTIHEKKPKFGFFYKPRDSKILYGLPNLIPKKTNKLKRSDRWAKIGASLSETIIESHKKMKRKIIDRYSKVHSMSQTSEVFFGENIESLVQTIPESTSEVQALEREKKKLSNIFTENDYLTYKTFKNSKNINSIRYAKRWKLNYFSKSKLLGIIHLALLLMGSCVQLGDLLRFIRENHLSFAKVTHFLPEEIKLSKGDVSFIETVSDLNMPTHLKQRKIGSILAKSLGLEEIPLPNMNVLINRYCVELNLPEIIAHYGREIWKNMDSRKLCRLKSKSHLPNFEALAVAAIIFVIKLLFGLDGVTEVILSDLAQKVNSLFKESDKRLFVFNKWQKHVECRKALLEHLHYPTEEKLGINSVQCSESCFDILKKENKDEHRDERHKVYSQYYVDRRLLKSTKDVLECLKDGKDSKRLNFPPSLTPHASYLEEILNVYGDDISKKDNSKMRGISPPILNLLTENYAKCCIDFIFSPTSYAEELLENNYKIIWISKFEFNNINFETESEDDRKDNFIKFSELSKSKKVFFIENPYYYWTVNLSPKDKKFFYEFKRNVFLKTPVNFQWLLTECSAMLELNQRELYKELRLIEKNMKLFFSNVKGKTQ